MSKEDIICEEYFVKTYYRESTGRYVVRLPIKKQLPNINNSYELAIKRFQQVEKTLVKQPEIYSMYKEFVVEYENEHHMEIVKHGE